jgi:Protein of unknown function (DUF642)
MNYKSLLALGFFVVSGFASANILTNGNFEANPPSDLVDGGYSVIGVGSGGITGWTVTGAPGKSVDLIKNGYGSINNISVDLMGTPGPATLSQNFFVVSGTTYQLDFDLSGNGNGPHSFSLNFGSYSEIFNASSVGSHVTRTFTASTSGFTSIDFTASGNDVYGGPVIDNVVIAAVPLTGTLVLVGLGVAAALVRRNKQ